MSSGKVQGGRVTISIVSHGQGELVRDLLQDISSLGDVSLDVILTLNIPETISISEGEFRFPLVLKKNAVPKGFGANHNAAAREATGTFFCVLNPDVRLFANPFPTLTRLLVGDVGVAAPHVLTPAGRLEDSARRLPTPLSIFLKVIAGQTSVGESERAHPDWIAGMFMLFRRDLFIRIGGFDERYFLYYEDVDICSRLWLNGYKVKVSSGVTIVHGAQRSSHRELRYFVRHCASMLRFFASSVFIRRMWQKKVTRLM